MTAAVALPPAALPRLGSLLRLLGSDQDGEALGAARAIRRVLAGFGLTVHDLAAAVERPGNQGALNPARQREPGVQRHGGSYVVLDAGRRAATILTLSRALNGSVLSAWEREFALSMVIALRNGGRLSVRQWAKICDIVAQAGEG